MGWLYSGNEGEYRVIDGIRVLDVRDTQTGQNQWLKNKGMSLGLMDMREMGWSNIGFQSHSRSSKHGAEMGS